MKSLHDAYFEMTAANRRCRKHTSLVYGLCCEVRRQKREQWFDVRDKSKSGEINALFNQLYSTACFMRPHFIAAKRPLTALGEFLGLTPAEEAYKISTLATETAKQYKSWMGTSTPLWIL